MKIGLIIPIYNVENTIARVLDELKGDVLKNISIVLIIDNCSTDKTVEILEKYLDPNKVLGKKIIFLRNKKNYGYGCSIKTGFEFFLNEDIDYLTVIHGDYQASPKVLLKNLISEIELNNELDLVLSSRFTKKSDTSNYSIVRRLGNYFFNKVTYLCSGYNMSDAGTAMMIVKKELLQKVPYYNLSNSWQFHPQLNILFFHLKNVEIKEIPMNWSDSDALSTVGLISYGRQLLWMLIKFWFSKNIKNILSNEIFDVCPINCDREFAIAYSGKKLTNEIDNKYDK